MQIFINPFYVSHNKIILLIILLGQSIGSENVAQRIIELSKKNRDLTAEVESGKTKYRQIQNELQKLENEVRTALYWFTLFAS